MSVVGDYQIRRKRTNKSMGSIPYSYTCEWCEEKVGVCGQRVVEGVFSVLYATRDLALYQDNKLEQR